MRKFFILAVAALGLAGCDLNFTPAEQALIQGDLNALCPQIAALDPQVRATFNGNVALALSSVELACPPNPPPTNIVTILSDIIVVGQALAPRLHTLTAKRAAVHAQTIAAAHGIAVTK